MEQLQTRTPSGLDIATATFRRMSTRYITPEQVDIERHWLLGSMDEASKLIKLSPAEAFEAGPVAAG